MKNLKRQWSPKNDGGITYTCMNVNCQHYMFVTLSMDSVKSCFFFLFRLLADTSPSEKTTMNYCCLF